MKVVYSKKKDLEKIAICHKLAFPDSITTKLGVKAIVGMMNWYLSSESKFLFHIDLDDKIIGFCGGYIKDGSDIGSATGMTQFGFKSVALSLLSKPWLMFHPEVRKKYSFILTNLLRKVGLKKHKSMALSATEQNNELLTAGLVVIGVHPNWQGKGIGTILQTEFEAKARSMGAKCLQLSVRTSNNQAIKSYQRNGYVIQKEEGPSYVMVKNLG
jgi:ribosomal protein S18 acetylase RimI-like enzyme